MIQTRFQLTVDVVQTGSWLVRDAGGSRTHFDRVAAGCLAIWLQRHCARSVEWAMFVYSSLKVVVAVRAIKSGLI